MGSAGARSLLCKDYFVWIILCKLSLHKINQNSLAQNNLTQQRPSDIDLIMPQRNTEEPIQGRPGSQRNLWFIQNDRSKLISG